MSEQQFENWLRLLSRLLRLDGEQRDRIGRELRDHFETQLADLLARGVSRDDAIARALDDLGDAAAMAHDLSRMSVRRRWMMRTTIGVGIAAAVALVVSVSLPPAPQARQTAVGQDATPGTARPAVVVTAPSRDSVGDRKTRARLAAPIEDLTLDDITFDNIMMHLRELTGLNIHVNWRAIEFAGVEREAPITLWLHDVPFEQALRLILDDVAGGEADLGYAVEDSVVYVSTRDDLSRKTLVRVYWIHDLLDPALSSAQKVALRNLMRAALHVHDTGKVSGTDAPAKKEAAPAAGLGGGAIGDGGGFTPLPGRRDPAETVWTDLIESITAMLEDEDADDLCDVIRETIERDTWRENGGDIGAVRYLKGVLVITQTEAVHRQVRELLDMLREGRGAGR